MAPAVAMAPGLKPPRAKAAPNSAGRASLTRTTAQYPGAGPDTVGTGLDVPACTLTVSMPDVVNPFADASMHALSKLVDGEAGAAAGQFVAAPHQTAPAHVGPLGSEVTAARTAAIAAASAAACAACCR